MKTIKLYFRFLAVHLKTAMAYKGSFILSCIGQLLITTNVFLGVKFLLDRFGSVGGYRLPELTLWKLMGRGNMNDIDIFLLQF